MRLINTRTQVLDEFEPTTAPPYAILSHTWTDHEEIRHQDLLTERTPGKDAGYAKVDNGCRIALAKGYDYMWIDTCCIDKTNNVELSEAINSMFYWYKKAGICLAYLADVPSDVEPSDKDSLFPRSRWFTRGWTLQELLAPSEVIFLADNWTEIGSRTELVSEISTVTGVPKGYLLGKDPGDASVAMRFSWAADRRTTKPEDIAYCLMGIFDIQMSLLYGEREAGAFRRLQQKIIKTSDDHSIFAWKWKKREGQDSLEVDNARRNFTLLAPSPDLFRCSHNVHQTKAPVVPGYLDGIRTPTLFNNKGLNLAFPIIPMSIIDQGDPKAIAILNCCVEGNDTLRLAICLQDVSTNGGRYVRVYSYTLISIPINLVVGHAKYARISVRQGEVAQSADRISWISVIEVLETKIAQKYQSSSELQNFERRLNLSLSDFQAMSSGGSGVQSMTQFQFTPEEALHKPDTMASENVDDIFGTGFDFTDTDFWPLPIATHGPSKQLGKMTTPHNLGRSPTTLLDSHLYHSPSILCDSFINYPGSSWLPPPQDHQLADTRPEARHLESNKPEESQIKEEEKRRVTRSTSKRKCGVNRESEERSRKTPKQDPKRRST